jgi:hypothetical protein
MKVAETQTKSGKPKENQMPSLEFSPTNLRQFIRSDSLIRFLSLKWDITFSVSSAEKPMRHLLSVNWATKHCFFEERFTSWANQVLKSPVP